MADAMSVGCELYRHFDASGKLLYVGISLFAIRRLAQHGDSAWFSQIAIVKIERFPDRETAALAEAIAINFERPAFNRFIPQIPEEIRRQKLRDAVERIRRDIYLMMWDESLVIPDFPREEIANVQALCQEIESCGWR
jgi:hypothetical protein